MRRAAASACRADTCAAARAGRAATGTTVVIGAAPTLMHNRITVNNAVTNALCGQTGGIYVCVDARQFRHAPHNAARQKPDSLLIHSQHDASCLPSAAAEHRVPLVSLNTSSNRTRSRALQLALRLHDHCALCRRARLGRRLRALHSRRARAHMQLGCGFRARPRCRDRSHFAQAWPRQLPPLCAARRAPMPPPSTFRTQRLLSLLLRSCDGGRSCGRCLALLALVRATRILRGQFM